MELFDRCIEVVLRSEGGYVNDPDDPGGETKYGIAKRFFPDEDIKNLTIERAKELYKKKYWDPMKLEGIQDPEAVLQIFDMGVNAGIRRSIKIAQRVVMVKEDGYMGPITRASINAYKGFLEDFKQGRRNYYTALVIRRPRSGKFLKGWMNRIDKTKLT